MSTNFNLILQGQLECTTVLLDHGADPNIEDFEGRTLNEWREKDSSSNSGGSNSNNNSSSNLANSSSTKELGRSRGNTDASRKDGKGKGGFTPLHSAVAFGYYYYLLSLS